MTRLQCRRELVKRQQLTQEDYKVNKGLAEACQRDILLNNCVNKDQKDPGFTRARLSQIVLCLENAMKGMVVATVGLRIDQKLYSHTILFQN